MLNAFRKTIPVLVVLLALLSVVLVPANADAAQNTKARGHWTYKIEKVKVIPTDPGTALAVSAVVTAGVDGFENARVPSNVYNKEAGRWAEPSKTSEAWKAYWEISYKTRDDKLFNDSKRGTNWQRRWKSHAECSTSAPKAIWLSGVDDYFVGQGTKAQLNYCKNHPGKWKYVGTYVRKSSSNFTTSKNIKLQPGDVLVRDGHIAIYAGREIVRLRFPKSNSVFVESSFHKKWQATTLRWDKQKYYVFRPRKLDTHGMYYSSVCAKYKKQYSPETKDVKVKDKYVYDYYHITYKGLPKTMTAPKVTKYKYDTATFSIPDPSGTKEGYTFVGWYTKSEGGVKITKIKKGSMSDYTLYARFTKNKTAETPSKTSTPSNTKSNSNDATSKNSSTSSTANKNAAVNKNSSASSAANQNANANQSANVTTEPKLMDPSVLVTAANRQPGQEISIRTGWTVVDENGNGLKEGQSFKYTGNVIKPIFGLSNGTQAVSLGTSFTVTYLPCDAVRGTKYALIRAKSDSGYKDAFIYTFKVE